MKEAALNVLTLVMNAFPGDTDVCDYYYFHRELQVGDLIDIDTKLPPGIFQGTVIKAFNRGAGLDAAGIFPHRIVVVASDPF